MKKKWHQRLYIDLYAGGGISHIQGTRTFLKGSPLIALTVDSPLVNTSSARRTNTA